MPQRRSAKMPSRVDSYAKLAPSPSNVREAIDEECDRLRQLDSLLGCLAIAMEYEGQTADTPYFPDVVRHALVLLKQSVSALEQVVSKAPQSDAAVEEGSRLSPVILGPPLPDIQPLQPAIATAVMASGDYNIEVHRRETHLYPTLQSPMPR